MNFLIIYLLIVLSLYVSVTMRNPNEDSMFFFMAFLLALVWPVVPIIIFIKVINERV